MVHSMEKYLSRRIAAKINKFYGCPVTDQMGFQEVQRVIDDVYKDGNTVLYRLRKAEQTVDDHIKTSENVIDPFLNKEE